MCAVWVAGNEPEHGDEGNGGKSGSVRSQAGKTENESGGKYFPEMVFCLKSACRVFQRPLVGPAVR